MVRNSGIFFSLTQTLWVGDITALIKATAHWSKGLPPTGTSAIKNAKPPIAKDSGILMIDGTPEKKRTAAKDRGIIRVKNCRAVKLPKSLNLKDAMFCGTECCCISFVAYSHHSI